MKNLTTTLRTTVAVLVLGWGALAGAQETAANRFAVVDITKAARNEKVAADAEPPPGAVGQVRRQGGSAAGRRRAARRQRPGQRPDPGELPWRRGHPPHHQGAARNGVRRGPEGRLHQGLSQAGGGKPGPA